MIRHIFTAITAIFIIIFLKACANIQAPQGGPKDAKPPKVVKSYPKPNSIDFIRSSMFDERKEILLYRCYSNCGREKD